MRVLKSKMFFAPWLFHLSWFCCFISCFLGRGDRNEQSMCQGPLPAPAHLLLCPVSTCPLGKGWGNLAKYLPYHGLLALLHSQWLSPTTAPTMCWGVGGSEDIQWHCLPRLNLPQVQTSYANHVHARVHAQAPPRLERSRGIRKRRLGRTQRDCPRAGYPLSIECFEESLNSPLTNHICIDKTPQSFKAVTLEHWATT